MATVRTVFVLLFLSIAALAQTTIVRIAGSTLDAAGVTGSVAGTITITGPFSEMNFSTWNIVINGIRLKPSNSNFAGKEANSFLLRPGGTVRAFYMFRNDGRVLFLMVPAKFFRDDVQLGDKVPIFPVGLDLSTIFGSGLYQSSLMPVAQITAANMHITAVQ